MLFRGRRARQNFSVLSKVSRWIFQVELKAGRYLSEKSKNWSSTTKLAFLIVIVAVMGGASLYILLDTLYSDNSREVFQKERLNSVVMPPLPNFDFVTPSADDPVASLKRKLDSFMHNPETREKLQQVLQSRPGLADSLQKILQEPFDF